MKPGSYVGLFTNNMPNLAKYKIFLAIIIKQKQRLLFHIIIIGNDIQKHFTCVALLAPVSLSTLAWAFAALCFKSCKRTVVSGSDGKENVEKK